MRRTICFIVVGAVLALGLAACNLPSSTPDAAATLRAVYTAQVITPGALQTESVDKPGFGTQAPLPTLVFPTLPGGTPTPAVPQDTAVLPVQPTFTQAVPCDWVSFVTDVTIPDRTILDPGVQFTKVWRLKNIGACTWTTSYSLVFLNGNSLNGITTTPLPETVAPGQTVDISLTMTAPSTSGEYKGYWMLRNAAGQNFGVGKRNADPFWVDIQVIGPMSQVYDFAAQYCTATWSSSEGNLSCPGDFNSNSGNANKIQNPNLENGQLFEGLGLLTVPENTKDGYIKGLYPAFAVQKGDHFRSLINCAYKSNGCNVIFQLSYQLSDGTFSTLWQYNEVYDGKSTTVDTDLSTLDGNSVQFMLAVYANGTAKNDQPLWINPRIERLNSLITPTVTPTVTLTPHP